ncbi:squalene synthase HpnC [Parvularcula sp. ZS-1/3]|uniref:Squalene synthase HpnC n=1 Tax=Parvularcula mediterranea TaxID=2732508 RepID=A0A7Y3W4P8_9PROT|nr:squalene synthase HpnC [Parvularcula mediterranea]NNU15698.1 squalene synthase HpnC [Parvularcula mediterranea]
MPEIFRDEDIEAASGKGADDENFPVGSFLIAPPLRPHVKAYYDFARGADDIGDDPDLLAEEKVRRLKAYRAVLHGEGEGLSKPSALRASLLEAGVPLERGSDLLVAFEQDCRKDRYASLDELLGYCRYSANPVGQFLLDLHGEDRALFGASDALCTSLQILNHLQDLKEDFREIGRSYLPADWLAEEDAVVEDVTASKASPGLRRVIDRLLEVCSELNQQAEELVSGLKSRRLAAESAVILKLAKRLRVKLAEADPIAGRVALSKADFLKAGAAGFVQGVILPRRAA